MTSGANDAMFRRGARLIWRSLRAHPWPHAVAMFGAAVFVFSAVGGAWVLRWVTDEVVVPAFETGTIDGDTVWTAMGAIVGISAMRGISIITRRWFLAMAEMRTQRDWRRDLLGHYLDLPLRFHRTRPTGELLAHADIDVQTATMVLKPLAFSMSVVLLVIVAIVSILAIHPLLALIAAVLFPALVTMSHVYTSKVEAPAARAQQRVGEVSGVAHESFDGALVVKTLGRQDEEVERMREASEHLRAERIAVGRLRGTFEPLIDALPNVGIIVLLLVGASLVSEGQATPGDLVLAVSLFSLLATPLRVLGFFLEEMPRSVVSLERVDRVMAEEAEYRGGAHRLPDGPLDVEIDGLSVAHTDHAVVHDVRLSVAAGETVALVGATGSGKSTLVEAIVGLLEGSAGEVRIGGVPVVDLAPGEIADSAAVVFQESFLFADSIAENVGLGVDDPTAVGHALAIAHADDFVADMPQGIDTVVGERGVTLSGGQRQRIALARALVRAPRLLLLDDATSAVDPVVEAEILGNLRAGLDTTLLIVAHRLSTIRLADRVAYLDEGRLIATGTHDELLTRDDYRSLVTAYEQGERV